MALDKIKFQSRILVCLHHAYWVPVVLLTALMLAGCVTSYAAGPPEAEQTVPAAANLTQSSPKPTPTQKTSVTLVPNTAIRAFQETTPTVTATVTPTVTATVTPTVAPDTPSPTVEPTDTPVPTDTPFPTNTPAPTTTSVVVRPTLAPFQAYAWVDNYYPAPNSVVTVYGQLLKKGRPVNGAQMGVTWSYTHREGYCTAYTNIEGKAACSQNIGLPLQNYWVYLDVVFIHEDETYYAKTGFVTDP